MNRVSVVAMLVAIGLLTSSLVSCTPPFPVHKRTVALGGTVRNLADPKTVKPGISRRDEVLIAFKDVDTRALSRWFFWGRWSSSSWAMWVFADSPGPERLWSLTNFLVEFDEAGTVTKTTTVSDDRIISELLRIPAERPESPEMIPAAPVVLAGHVSPSKKGHWCQSNIVISRSTIEFSMNEHCRPSHLSLPLQGLTVGNYAKRRGEGPDPALLRFTLRSAAELGISGFGVSLKPNDLVMLLRLLQASR